MKVTEIIGQSEKSIFSFELLPPLKGNDASRIYRTIETLIGFDPKYINITTHRDEIEFRENPDGTIRKKVVRKRPGTVAIAASIQYKYGIPVVPHIVCGGFTRSETEHVLIDLHFLGINNVLALRGDGLKGEQVFRPEPDGNLHAVDLVEQISRLKKGIYLDPDLKNTTPLDFCTGVAGYPEKHSEAPNLETDLLYLKKKVEAGAEYVVTQMFFDNRVYFDFVAKCRNVGITVPIIPGIKPIALMNQLYILPKLFSIHLPGDLVKALLSCKTDDDARKAGTEWAISQARELVAANVPGLHIYTYGISDNVREIVKAVF
jgi:methylenetetrahydrofolate reductase (NADPH)